MKIFKHITLKKLLLGSLTTMTVFSPILITSCSSNTDRYNNDSNDNNTSDNSEPSNPSTTIDSENYTAEQMVESGTNDKELSDNQKSRQNLKNQTIESEYNKYSSISDTTLLTQGYQTYKNKGSEFEDKIYKYYTEYQSLVGSNSTSQEQFTDFWILIAQAYKDNGFEYGFVTRAEYEQKYQTTFEAFLKDYDKSVLLTTGNSNYSYTSFIYHTLSVSIWGDIMMYHYLEKKLYDIASTIYVVPEDVSWYYNNATDNLKTEVNLYSNIYSALLS